MLEGGPYKGSDVRTSIWTFAIGGGHFFFHADGGQETVKTGIMGYDPYVKNGDKGMYKRDWLGHASRLFNQHMKYLDEAVPANSLCSNAYCLAVPGKEYVAYSKSGASTTFSVNLSAAAGKQATARFYDPRKGTFGNPVKVQGGAVKSFTKPSSDDWVLHIVVD